MKQFDVSEVHLLPTTLLPGYIKNQLQTKILYMQTFIKQIFIGMHIMIHIFCLERLMKSKLSVLEPLSYVKDLQGGRYIPFAPTVSIRQTEILMLGIKIRCPNALLTEDEDFGTIVTDESWKACYICIVFSGKNGEPL